MTGQAGSVSVSASVRSEKGRIHVQAHCRAVAVRLRYCSHTNCMAAERRVFPLRVIWERNFLSRPDRGGISLEPGLGPLQYLRYLNFFFFYFLSLHENFPGLIFFRDVLSLL